MTQKLTFSLPDEDAEYLTALAAVHNGNRSAALHDVFRRVRELDAADAYSSAFDEWEASGEGSLWSPTAADGIRG